MAESPTLLALLLLLGLTSYRGHRSPEFHARWIFDVERIRLRREYHRFITGCGLHADLMHFGFNAITIYLFGDSVDYALGGGWLLLIFFGSVLGGSLLSFWLHRRDAYLSLGASGGACGLIFAAILLFPDMSVSLGIVPGWIYALLFIIGSYYAHHRKQDNVGHIAHLGGALGGVMITLLHAPGLLFESPWTTWLSLCVLLAVCAYLTVCPHGFALRALTGGVREHRAHVRYQRYDDAARRQADNRRMDALLDKISRLGTEGLNTRERNELAKLSEARRKSRRPGTSN